LGKSPEPSAIGLLERAYRFEPDPAVRRAILRASAERREPAKKRLLRLAATLDPDKEAREAARIALSGATIAPPVTGPSTVWLSLVPNSAGLGAARRPLLVVVPGGLALPVVSDPDGIVALARLARGPVSLRLAPSFERGKARNR
jgi:HEAT repeats